MADAATQKQKKDRFNWWLALYGALGACIVGAPAVVWTDYTPLELFILRPAVILGFGIALVTAAVFRKPRRVVSILLMAACFWCVSDLLIRSEFTIRTAIRWALWSRDYKARVSARPAPAKDELKHIEWDGWGFGGEDTVVYLVFDPTDSLSAAAKSHAPGKFAGIPCEVFTVDRLEAHWYTAHFYTGRIWERCL